MANDVKVVIELSKAAARLGFGYPLIFDAVGTESGYGEVGSLSELANLGYLETSETYKAASVLFMQENAPSKIAIFSKGSHSSLTEALDAVLEKGWRQLIMVGGKAEDVKTISDYIEACGKDAMYFVAVSLSTTTANLKEYQGNKRTVIIQSYTGTTSNYADAALVGATAGLDVGSFTYKNIVLKGVSGLSMTTTGVEALHQIGAICVIEKAGSVVTSEGTTMSKEYIDIVDCQDYIIQQIEYQCQVLLNRVPKLPYDNRGVAALEGVVLSVLKDAANNGMIAVKDDGDYDYSVTFLPRSECAASDISTRHYAEGSFEFALAGAIHTAKIKGTIIA